MTSFAIIKDLFYNQKNIMSKFLKKTFYEKKLAYLATFFGFILLEFKPKYTLKILI